MVRTSKWKLVRHHRARGLDELYDLEADPGETKNLLTGAERRAVREELEGRLAAWQRSIGDLVAQAE